MRPGTVFDHIDNGKCIFVNIDFPEVIELRRKQFDQKEREINIGKDANDMGLPEVIDVRKEPLPQSERETLIAGDLFDMKWAEEVDGALPLMMLVLGHSSISMKNGFWMS